MKRDAGIQTLFITALICDFRQIPQLPGILALLLGRGDDSTSPLDRGVVKIVI